MPAPALVCQFVQYSPFAAAAAGQELLLQQVVPGIILAHAGCGVVCALSAAAMGKNPLVAAVKVGGQAAARERHRTALHCMRAWAALPCWLWLPARLAAASRPLA